MKELMQGILNEKLTDFMYDVSKHEHTKTFISVLHIVFVKIHLLHYMGCADW